MLHARGTRTPSQIRLVQAALTVHGIGLLLAGLMLLAAADGSHPLLSADQAKFAAFADFPLGVAMLAASAYLGRRESVGIRFAATLEAIAFVSAPLLTLPLLILFGVAASAGVSSAMLPRDRSQAFNSPGTASSALRIAQATGLLHGTCLLIAAGALLGAAGDATAPIPRADAALNAYVNGPLGVLIATAAVYLYRGSPFGRAVLALAEVAAFLLSLLLHVPLLIALDISLSCIVETSLIFARRATPRSADHSTAMPWPKMSLPWVAVTVVAAFFGFAAGGYAATEQSGDPNAPLLWIGGVLGAVAFGAVAAAVGHAAARRAGSSQPR